MKPNQNQYPLGHSNISLDHPTDKRPSLYTSFQNIDMSKVKAEENKENVAPSLQAKSKTNVNFPLKESEIFSKQTTRVDYSSETHNVWQPPRFSLHSKLMVPNDSDSRLNRGRQSNPISAYPGIFIGRFHSEKPSFHSKTPFAQQDENFKSRLFSTQSTLNKSQISMQESSSIIVIYEDPMCPYYSSILTHLMRTQSLNRSLMNPLKLQSEINKRMRSVLFNWLLQIHHKFQMKPRTFMIMSNIFDRFLLAKNVQRCELQLVGMATLLIASKYEDIYPPELKELCALADYTFTKEQILEAEGKILSVLCFDMMFVSTLDVMDILAKIWRIVSKDIIEFASMILFIFAFYHFNDKFGVFKLAAFALAYASKVEMNRVLMESNKYLNSYEYDFLLCKLKKVISRLQYDNLTVLSDRFACYYAKII